MDDKWATVGSSNLDPLSLSLNLEANVFIDNEAFNQQLYEHFNQLVNNHCKKLNIKTALRGLWWRAPIIFLSFHFLRKFPTIMGWLPAHTHELKLVTPSKDFTDSEKNHITQTAGESIKVTNAIFKNKQGYEKYNFAKNKSLNESYKKKGLSKESIS
jgi:cardiolipin synthase